MQMGKTVVKFSKNWKLSSKPTHCVYQLSIDGVDKIVGYINVFNKSSLTDEPFDNC